MNREQIIRAWKDEAYRQSLSEGEQMLVPDHPAGVIELSDAQLGFAGGEEASVRFDTLGCCNGTVWFYACGSFKVFSLGCACEQPAI